MYGIMSALPVAVTILCFLFSGGYYRTEYDSIALHHGSIKRPFAVIVVNGNDRPVDLKNGSFFLGLELIVTEDVDVDGFLMAEAAKDRTRYHDQLVAAIEFNVSEHKLKVLHNNNLLHSSGIAINLASNLLLHYYGYPEADVTAKNSPSNRRLQVDSFAPYLFTEAISLCKFEECFRRNLTNAILPLQALCCTSCSTCSFRIWKRRRVSSSCTT